MKNKISEAEYLEANRLLLEYSNIVREYQLQEKEREHSTYGLTVSSIHITSIDNVDKLGELKGIYYAFRNLPSEDLVEKVRAKIIDSINNDQVGKCRISLPYLPYEGKISDIVCTKAELGYLYDKGINGIGYRDEALYLHGCLVNLPEIKTPKFLTISEAKSVYEIVKYARYLSSKHDSIDDISQELYSYINRNKLPIYEVMLRDKTLFIRLVPPYTTFSVNIEDSSYCEYLEHLLT